MRVLITLMLLAIFFSCSQSQKNMVAENQNTIDDSVIIVNPKHYSIGTVSKQGADSIHAFEFQIRNISEDSVVIDKVDVSCSCVLILNYPHVLPPMSEGLITGNVNISNQFGHLSKAIFINYNDDGITVMRIIGDIKSK